MILIILLRWLLPSPPSYYTHYTYVNCDEDETMEQLKYTRECNSHYIYELYT